MRRNLLFGALVVALFFGLLEGGLRLSGLVSTDALRSPDVETLDAIPGFFEPGQDLVDRVKPSVPYHVHINSLGFRGPEFPIRKRQGSYRVLCIGDSYTFGAHVQDEEAFPARLGRLLAEVDGRIEVINGGASGFTITDEVVYMRAKGLSLEPDLVVLAFCQNDIRDLSRKTLMIDSMRDHAELKSAFLVGPLVKFLQHTALFNGMQRTAAWINVTIRKSRQASILAGSPELFRKYRAGLAELDAMVRQRGAALVFVVWPSAEQIAGNEPLDPQRELAGITRDLGIEQVDLTPELARLQAGGVPAFLVPLDGHPSPRGQDLAARVLAERLGPRIAAALAGRAP